MTSGPRSAQIAKKLGVTKFTSRFLNSQAARACSYRSSCRRVEYEKVAPSGETQSDASVATAPRPWKWGHIDGIVCSHRTTSRYRCTVGAFCIGSERKGLASRSHTRKGRQPEAHYQLIQGDCGLLMTKFREQAQRGLSIVLTFESAAESYSIAGPSFWDVALSTGLPDIGDGLL
jgi:hypothetical protein